MSSNNAFTNHGATPKLPSFQDFKNSITKQTNPQVDTAPHVGVSSLATLKSNNIPMGNNPGLIKTGLTGQDGKPVSNPFNDVKPQTPLKKQTVNNVDGSSTVNEYHAPATPDTPAPATPKTPNQADIISNIQKAGETTPDEKAFQDQYVKSVEGKQFGQLAPYAESSMYAGKTPEQLQGLITAPDLAGRASADTGLYNTLGNAYGNAALAGLSAAQTSAARNLSAQTTAGQLNAPVTQFGQLTNPVSGGIIGGGTTGTNPQLASAVDQAIQLVKAGTSPQDPSVQALIAPFQVNGQQAFTSAMQQLSNGTYNPTSANAVAQSNAAQGVNYKQSAVDLDTSLKQLDTASTLADNFLNNNKLLNPTENPDINSGINTYIGKFSDPAAHLQYNAILGDIKKFTSTILASNNGTIPTDVTNTLSSFDPSTLTANQLKPYLQALSQLGNNQLSVVQSQVGKLLPGQNAYSGTPATINTTPVATPASTQPASALPVPAQAAIGTIMNIAGGTVNAIKGLASKIFQ